MSEGGSPMNDDDWFDRNLEWIFLGIFALLPISFGYLAMTT